MNLAKKAVVAAAMLTGLGVAFSAQAGPVVFEHGPNLVANGDFETGLAGWTQWGNTGFTGTDCFNGCFGTAALFAGPIGSVGGIQQDLATTVGANYNIHLFLQNSVGGSGTVFQVEWGIGNVVYSVVDDSAHGYTEIIIDPMATSATTTLRIGFQHDPDFWNMDNVSVVQVPEPFSLALLGLGLGALGLSRRRKQA